MFAVYFDVGKEADFLSYATGTLPLLLKEVNMNRVFRSVQLNLYSEYTCKV